MVYFNLLAFAPRGRSCFPVKRVINAEHAGSVSVSKIVADSMQESTAVTGLPHRVTTYLFYLLFFAAKYAATSDLTNNRLRAEDRNKLHVVTTVE